MNDAPGIVQCAARMSTHVTFLAIWLAGYNTLTQGIKNTVRGP